MKCDLMKSGFNPVRIISALVDLLLIIGAIRLGWSGGKMWVWLTATIALIPVATVHAVIWIFHDTSEHDIDHKVYKGALIISFVSAVLWAIVALAPIISA